MSCDFDVVVGRYAVRPNEPRATPTRVLQTAVTKPQTAVTEQQLRHARREEDDALFDSQKRIQQALENIAACARRVTPSWKNAPGDRAALDQISRDADKVGTLCRQQTQLLTKERGRGDELAAQLAAREFEDQVSRAVAQRVQEATAQPRAPEAPVPPTVAPVAPPDDPAVAEAKRQTLLSAEALQQALNEARIQGLRNPEAARRARAQRQAAREGRAAEDQTSLLDELEHRRQRELKKLAKTHGTDSDVYQRACNTWDATMEAVATSREEERE